MLYLRKVMSVCHYINDIVTYFLLLEIIRDPNVIKYTHFPMVLSVKNHHHYSKTLLKVQYNRVLGYYLRMQAKPLSNVHPATPFPFDITVNLSILNLQEQLVFLTTSSF